MDEEQTTYGFNRRKKVLVAVFVALAVAVVTVGLIFIGRTDTNASPSSQLSDSQPLDTTTSKANSAGHTFYFYNGCSQNIWVGALNNPGKMIPNNGGWLLSPGGTSSVQVPAAWAGRFWGRTGCNSAGTCETGDCGNRIQCSGAGGNPPATLAEFTLDDNTGTDWYDVSLVDGYNLPMQIAPVANSYYKVSSSMYDCGIAGCNTDLNANCPADLQKKNSQGQVVACMSACEKYNSDNYCCRGSFGTPQTCPATDYSRIFKNACPGAYSYAYDDPTSTFTCHGSPATNYMITFCPSTQTTGNASPTSTGSAQPVSTSTTTTSSGGISGVCGAGTSACNPSYQVPNVVQCCSSSQTCMNNNAGFGVCCPAGQTHCLTGGISACCTGQCNPNGGCL